MKINYCSDLHLNYISKEEQEPIFQALESPADVLIIAGDLISHHSRRLNAARELVSSKITPHADSKPHSHAYEILDDHNDLVRNLKNALRNFGNPVIYVPGNHEFHGIHLSDGPKTYGNMFSNNVMYLNNESVMIQKQKFVCSTMWYEPTDFKGSSDFHVTDFRTDFDQVAQDAKNYLEAEVTKDSIVVTHMLPSNQCIHPMWKSHESNVVFVRDMEYLINEKQPHTWIYGHSHDPAEDFILGSTQIVANPRGNQDANSHWKMKSFNI